VLQIGLLLTKSFVLVPFSFFVLHLLGVLFRLYLVIVFIALFYYQFGS
jgi:hypothetical protein